MDGAPEVTSMSQQDAVSTFREHLTRLPQLANTMIHTNIRGEIEKLKSASSWSQPTRRSLEALAKYKDFRIVVVVMKQDAHMSDHRADDAISVHCIQGRVKMWGIRGFMVKRRNVIPRIK